MSILRLRSGQFLRKLTSLCLLPIAIVNLHGQGGPPMITDDPGTPGPRKWENNIAIGWEHRGGETSFDLPAIDLNYGVGERIQLTLQTAPVILKRNSHGPIGGLGGTEAALKWRFIDQEQDGLGFSMSMFPRIIFNIVQSSVRRGLSEDGTRFQLPFQIAKKIGIVDLDFECGAVASTVGRSEWLYGIVGAIEVTKQTELMAELHGTSRMSFDQDVLTVNFGVRQTLTARCILIGSLGHEVRAPAGESLGFIGYMGVQLLY
jgi:hypothetical protein